MELVNILFRAPDKTVEKIRKRAFNAKPRVSMQKYLEPYLLPVLEAAASGKEPLPLCRQEGSTAEDAESLHHARKTRGQ